jgi:hypothetical protein
MVRNHQDESHWEVNANMRAKEREGGDMMILNDEGGGGNCHEMGDDEVK